MPIDSGRTIVAGPIVAANRGASNGGTWDLTASSARSWTSTLPAWSLAMSGWISLRLSSSSQRRRPRRRIVWR
jgi:hypothetical protein